MVIAVRTRDVTVGVDGKEQAVIPVSKYNLLSLFSIWSLCNNYVTLSCLYAKFHWLISHVQLRFQPRQLTYTADWRIAECARRCLREFNPQVYQQVTEVEVHTI